ncbi:hypothetical protein LSH36_16g09040 [Paralvinella palmiformis]|uniref:Trimeric intracellular cation channel type 1B.1 n=1 Tax=Paralvinella palmiformis TaxID=53620 RepID=A0AAD9NHK2_9ANNE|nr:hypothetical protein LSH36_16g09040 [Paralvinella palmiformis]
MDPQTFMEIANVVTKLKMYPYFDVANYILMSIMVREDNHPQTAGSQLFSRKHPLACWIATMLLCFAGSILGNLLVGEPLILPFKNHQDLLTATAVWYLVNYSPFDLVYKLSKFLPFKLTIACLKEIQRAHKIQHGVQYAMKLYPGSYVIIGIIGVLKGAGYYYMRAFERLVRGLWFPATNEILQPAFVTKGSLAATIIFILEKKGYIDAPHAVIYFGVVIFFIYFRLSSLLLGIHDPFVPFENLFCAIFMGGVVDAMRRALSREKVEENAQNARNAAKSKDEKKND